MQNNADLNAVLSAYLLPIMEQAVKNYFEQATLPKVETSQERTRIDGIRGLAKFLNVSVPRAQQIKNDRLLPFYNIGKKVHFYSDEITSIIEKGGLA